MTFTSNLPQGAAAKRRGIIHSSPFKIISSPAVML